jgi:HSP20 family protein
MFSLSDRMNRMFDGFFYPTTRDDESMSMWGWNPVVDIYDNDDHIVIKAEIPGVDKKDITIDIKDRVLTLKGERSSASEEKKDNFYRRERTFGKFERSFALPAEVNLDQVKADYKDGVLKIEIPKPEEHKPKQITIH